MLNENNEIWEAYLVEGWKEALLASAIVISTACNPDKPNCCFVSIIPFLFS